MSEKDVHLTTCIHYYASTKMYRSMQTCCTDGIRLHPNEYKFHLYHGLCLMFEHRIPESIRELNSLQDDEDLCLAANLILIQVHKQSKSQDVEAIRHLETCVRDKRKSATDYSISMAAIVLLFMGKSDKAIEYADKLLTRSPGSRDGRIAHAWINLMTSNHQEESSSSLLNESAKSRDTESLLLKGMSYIKKKQYHKAIETLSNLISSSPSLQPASIEKMKAALAIRDWDMVMDISGKIQQFDRHSIHALRFSILYSLVHQSDDRLTGKLNDFSTSLELREPKSAMLHFESAKLLSRLCQKDAEVMKFATSLADRSSYIDTEYQADVLCELGFQCLLLRKFKDAERHYKSVSKMNPNDMRAVTGLLQCSLYESYPRVSEEVLLNLETFEEIAVAKKDGTNLQLLYMCALTGEMRGKNPDDVVRLLDQIHAGYFKQLDNNDGSLSLEFYIRLQPDFVADVAKLFLDFAPIEPMTAIISGQNIPHPLTQAQSILEPVMSACPSHSQPLLLMSMIKFLTGKSPAALTFIDRCLEIDENNAQAHLLKARIHLHDGHFKAAENSLDIAVSKDFAIRDMTEYAMTNSCLLKQAKRYEDGISCLKNALEIVNRNRAKIKSYKLTQQKISMSFLMAQLYDHLDQAFDSERILSELENEFKDTELGVRIMIAKAVSAENKGSLDDALTILRAVGNQSIEYFILSRQMMANIYLKYKNDRKLYVCCFKEISDKVGTKSASLELADAYMRILEPEQAISVYESCLKKDPKDPMLTRKVGQALVKCHFFDKAITYYKASIKTSSEDRILNISLKYDLAELFHRMKRHQESQALIKSAMSSIDDMDQREKIHVTGWEVKLLFLLSQVQLVIDQKEHVITSLKRAYTLQTKVVRQIIVEKPDSVEEDTKSLIEIGMNLADLTSNYSKNHGEAIIYYKELLHFDHKNVPILTALANLELHANNNFESAQHFTSMILKYAPDDDDSVLMMIDVMMNRQDMESAFDQLVQFLDKKPNHNLALSRMIEAAKRLGRLSWIGNHITKVLKHNPSAESDPKFCFCRGVYQKLTNDSRSALASLYKCKNDPIFGARALILVIEICLNPENEVIGGSVFDNHQQSATGRHALLENNLKTANRLLEYFLKRYGESVMYHYLRNFMFLARRSHKSDLDQAIQGFNDMLRDDPECQHATYGIAVAHALASQVSKSKATMKKLLKQEWKSSDPDIMERAKLLLIDVYIQTNKSEPAKELIRQILSYNKSCIKAYEFAGHLMEKESHIEEAAENYRVAYELCCQRNAIIGFKLASCLLKGKHYCDAVDVGRQVLAIYPDYPKLREEIIDRALNARLNLY